ncbi:MAG: Double zinc ribbon [Pelotomaculum sp. PtaU1.Bin035]|nr:MAG: Double zinc ribbon [Pelotomaculum sp. PtaU1.Bin035]
MDYDKLEVNYLVRRLAGFFVTLIILIIIKAVITSLPSMDTLVFKQYGITIANIASAVISSIIIGLILIFGQDIAFRVVRIVPSYPEANPLINTVSILISIVIAYMAFNKILSPLFAKINLAWLYPVLFLCIAIFPVYRITALLFTSSGKITDLFIGERRAAASANTVVCPNCGDIVPESKFCSRCGKEMIREKADSVFCQKCGSVLKPGVKFCAKCGTGTASVESPIEESPPVEEAVRCACAQCNTPLEPGDEFCMNCGAKASVS